MPPHVENTDAEGFVVTAAKSYLEPNKALLGRADGEANRVAVLGMAHELARHGRFFAQRPAELADDALLAPVVEVELLADQGRAAAVDAAVAVGLEGPDAPLQQHALERLHAGGGRSHRP